MQPHGLKRVLVLVNPKSGLHWSFQAMREAFDRHWEEQGIELFYQFCQSGRDGANKAQKAVDSKTDAVLVVGGDGTVNSVGRVLVGSDVSLGVIPTGSGNGFARHFGIPLTPEKAVAALAKSESRRIDVGVIDDRPFFVTCSMAWDAAIVRSFEKSPFRGIVPYVFAGVYQFFEYSTQRMEVETDSGEKLEFSDPLVFTVANMTQYGGGARIAPQAQPDDGYLELVVALRQDIPILLANLSRVFDGSMNRVPEVVYRRFRRLKVRRERPAQVQVDGELVDASRESNVHVIPGGVSVLVPRTG